MVTNRCPRTRPCGGCGQDSLVELVIIVDVLLFLSVESTRAIILPAVDVA